MRPRAVTKSPASGPPWPGPARRCPGSASAASCSTRSSTPRPARPSRAPGRSTAARSAASRDRCVAQIVATAQVLLEHVAVADTRRSSSRTRGRSPSAPRSPPGPDRASTSRAPPHRAATPTPAPPVGEALTGRAGAPTRGRAGGGRASRVAPGARASFRASTDPRVLTCLAPTSARTSRVTSASTVRPHRGGSSRTSVLTRSFRRPPRVQLRAELTEQLGHASLDRRVDVLVGRIEREPPATDRLARPPCKASSSAAASSVGAARRPERADVRDPGLHVLRSEPLVDSSDRPRASASGGGRLGEPPGPQVRARSVHACRFGPDLQRHPLQRMYPRVTDWSKASPAP